MPDGLADAILLKRYVQQGSEPAFRAIVDRYASLAYSTCRRQLGTAELAEDCTQAVFLTLSRKAPSITGELTLAGWLYMTSRLTAKNLARKELARARKESPLGETLAAEGADLHLLKLNIDDALAKLNAAERQAIILRFFQGLSLSEVGRIQGVSEDAARMRVQRALRRMSPFAHGLNVPAAMDVAPAPSSIPPHIVLYEVKITWEGHLVTNVALKAIEPGFIDMGFIEPDNVNRKVKLTPTVQVGDVISTDAFISFGPKPNRLRFAYETGHTVRLGWTEEAGARIIPENQNPAPNEALVVIKASLDDPKPTP